MFSRRRALFITCAIAALLSAVPAGASAAWLTAAPLSPDAATANSAVSAAGPDGTAVVAWVQGADVAAAVKPSGTASFAAPIVVGAGDAPRVAVDDQGRVLVTWRAVDGVGLAERPPDGALAPSGYALITGAPTQHALAFNRAGRALITWATPGYRGLVTRARGAGSFSPAWSDAAARSYASLDVRGEGDFDAAWTVFAERDDTTFISRVVARRWGTAGPGALLALAERQDGGSPFVTRYAIQSAHLAGAQSPTFAWLETASGLGQTKGDLRSAGILSGGGGGVLTPSASFGSFSRGPVGPGVDFAGLALTSMTGGNDVLATLRYAGPAGFTSQYAIVSTTGAANQLPGAPALVPLSDDLLSTPAAAALAAGRALVTYGRGGAIEAVVRGSAGKVEGGTATVASGLVLAPGAVTAASDIAGGALTAWVGGSTIANPQVALYDDTPPQLDPITTSDPQLSGSALNLQAASVDGWSGSTTTWELGDGTSAAGPSVSHTYAAPGTYVVTATATDGAGNVAKRTRSIDVTAPAGPLPGTTPPASSVDPAPESPPSASAPLAATAAPTLSGVRLAPKRFKAASSGTTGAPVTGKTAGGRLTLSISRPAQVTLTVARLARGYLKGKACVAGRASTRAAKPTACTKRSTVQTVTVQLSAGQHVLRVPGRVGPRRLSAGTYELTAQASAGDQRSAAVAQPFTIRSR